MNSHRHRHLLKFIIAAVTLLANAAIASAQETPEQRVKFQTNLGSFTVKLYNDTPLHRNNFLALVREGAFNNLLFHRVTKNFMVQAGGDTHDATKHKFEAMKSLHLERIPAEIRYPEYFHKRGALAAARQSDDANPEKASDPIEFYIVIGQYFLEGELKEFETEEHGQMPDTVKQTYMTEGGSPHLDNEYTVFGEVIEGYKTIDKIQNRATDATDRPLKEIYIISAKIL